MKIQLSRATAVDCRPALLRNVFGFGLVTLACTMAATPASACACGCGIFDISNIFNDQPGGAVYVEYDYMDQNQNWSGLSRSPATANDDKEIRTNFYTLGGQYLFESGFGVMVEVPFWDRHFETAGGGPLATFNHAAQGDVRLTSVYSGFDESRDTGLSLGIKLPTGDFTYSGFDRDTEIGSGSTDLLVGGYHRGTFDPLATWRYFVQGRYQFAVASQGGYRPGNEFDAVAGVSYDAGVFEGIDISPLFQVLASIRRRDSEINANPLNSGYSRILLSPGVDVGLQNWIFHAEVDVPVYQNVIGQQLVAPVLFKASIAYAFQ